MDSLSKDSSPKKLKTQPGNKPPLRKIAGGLAIIIVSAGCFFVFCVVMFIFALTNPEIICQASLIPSQLNLEKFSDIEFPESASNLTYSIRTTDDLMEQSYCTYTVQFEIDPQDYDELVASFLNVEEIDLEEYNSSNYLYGISTQMQETGAEPTETSLVGWGMSAQPWSAKWILIDTSNSETWVVYIVAEKYW